MLYNWRLEASEWFKEKTTKFAIWLITTTNKYKSEQLAGELFSLSEGYRRRPGVKG